MQTNNYFSFQRFILLSKQSLIINKKLIGISIVGVSGAVFLILLLFQSSLDFHWKNQSYFNTFGFLFFGLGIIYSSLSFPAFRFKEKSMAYLLLPATASEKFAFEILTRIIVFILLFPALCWVIANLEAAVVHHYVPKLTDPQFSYSQAYSEITDKIDKGGSTDWFLRYVGIQSILFIFILPFTGACHFTKSPFLKTLFASAIIAGGYGLFIYLLSKGLDLMEYRPSGNRILFISIREQAFTFFAIAAAVIDIALLAIAWFRFKEKEA